MTTAELDYALKVVGDWIYFGLFLAVLAVLLRAVWPPPNL